MRIRWLLGILALSLSLCAVAQQKPISVVFLNPGFTGEKFWSDYVRFMDKAARDLGIEFQAVNGERNPSLIEQRAHEILKLNPKPDYLLFTNEHFMGPQTLRIFEGSGVKLFALHNTLNSEQIGLAGSSRERFKNWIGSLVPNDEEAGYLMGRALASLTDGQPTQMLAFTGVKQTPGATLRSAGLKRALKEAPNITLIQELYAEWIQQRAYEQARVLLPRYPDVELIWAANDEMAFGVKQAAEELGRQLRYSALNNSQRVLDARTSGRIDVLATGHFILGACALVMLHDYSRGVDFADRGGKDQSARVFRLVNAEQAAALKRALDQPELPIDFAQFSALDNPDKTHYTCSIDPLLESN